MHWRRLYPGWGKYKYIWKKGCTRGPYECRYERPGVLNMVMKQTKPMNTIMAIAASSVVNITSTSTNFFRRPLLNV